MLERMNYVRGYIFWPKLVNQSNTPYIIPQTRAKPNVSKATSVPMTNIIAKMNGKNKKNAQLRGLSIYLNIFT